jgi:hypothetical protein
VLLSTPGFDELTRSIAGATRRRMISHPALPKPGDDRYGQIPGRCAAAFPHFRRPFLRSRSAAGRRHCILWMASRFTSGRDGHDRADTEHMRIAALAVALFAIVIGVVGILSPDSLTMARRYLLDRPGVVLYVAGLIRVAMGLVLIVFAPRSRTPRILRVMGGIMALQGIVPQFIGIDRERVIFEQEVMLGHAALRVGAVIALASGCFVAFVVTPRRQLNPESRS